MAGVEDASDLITDLSRQSPAEWPIAYHHLRPVPKPAELPEELAFPGHDLLSLRRRDDGTAKPQSPSRLETLLVSPLAWLLAEVGAEDMSWATEELDVLARGNIAHDVFEHGVDEIDVMLKTRYQEWAASAGLNSHDFIGSWKTLRWREELLHFCQRFCAMRTANKTFNSGHCSRHLMAGGKLRALLGRGGKCSGCSKNCSWSLPGMMKQRTTIRRKPGWMPG